MHVKFPGWPQRENDLNKVRVVGARIDVQARDGEEDGNGLEDVGARRYVE